MAEEINGARTHPGPQRLLMASPAQARCGDWLDLRTGRAAASDSFRAKRRGFWPVAIVFAAVQAGGTLPIPLYVMWQPRFGFGAGVLTIIFAVYAIGSLIALVLIAPLSDQFGRRPALATAVALSALSAAIFTVANNVSVLVAARFISGIASGIVAATASAALAELDPQPGSRRASLTATTANLGGLGLGSLFAGIVAQYGQNPIRLVFVIYFIANALSLVALAFVTETVRRPDVFRWRLTGLQVPPQARRWFAVVGAAIFCAYTLNGLFSSLVPSFLAESLHQHSHAFAGAVSGSVFVIAVISQLLFQALTPRGAMTAGVSMLIASLGLIEFSLWTGSLVVFLAGTLAGGVAAGLTFMGGIATVNLVAQPEHRAQVVGAFLACAFTGLIIPSVSVGLASQAIGTNYATLCCTIAVGALAVATLTAIRGDRPAMEANRA